MNRERLIEQLEEARARTLHLVEPLTQRGSASPARSADEPNHVGPGSHRAFRGAVARAQPRWAGGVRRDAGHLQSVRASAAGARRADSSCRSTNAGVDGRDPIARVWSVCRGWVRSDDESAAARWIRLFHGAPARVSAQRDDPPDVAAEAGRAVSRAASVRVPADRPDGRLLADTGTWCGFRGGRVRVRDRRPRRPHTTTNVRGTRRRLRHSPSMCFP